MIRHLLQLFPYVRKLEVENHELRRRCLAQQPEITYLRAALDGNLTETSEHGIRTDDDSSLGAWINYQMKLAGITQDQIAKTANVTRQMVQRVAYGASTSARVQKAIAMALGYKNWADMEAGRQGVAA